MAKIRIVACPPGEAPQAVREAWIGLELPLPPGRLGHRRGWLTTGVVSGPRTWWRESCAYLLDGKRHLLFPADFCQECS